MNISLFITCLTDHFYPRTGIAVVKILEHLGHEVVFPEDQTCCGQPMYNGGFHADARDLARRLIRVFEGHEIVVTPSGSCAAMVREHMPGLFDAADPDRVRAEALASRTYEFLELLVDVLEVDLAALGARWEGAATYHRSCHLRGLGLGGGTARLADQVEALDLVPLPDVEQCCGFGGVFAVKYPQISGGMVEEKVRSIRDTGAGVVICNEAGCAMNIEGACRRGGAAPRVCSMAEIIAEGLGLLERETA